MSKKKKNHVEKYAISIGCDILTPLAAVIGDNVRVSPHVSNMSTASAVFHGYTANEFGRNVGVIFAITRKNEGVTNNLAIKVISTSRGKTARVGSLVGTESRRICEDIGKCIPIVTLGLVSVLGEVFEGHIFHLVANFYARWRDEGCGDPVHWNVLDVIEYLE